MDYEVRVESGIKKTILVGKLESGPAAFAANARHSDHAMIKQQLQALLRLARASRAPSEISSSSARSL
jgi:hypothetical protein